MANRYVLRDANTEKWIWLGATVLSLIAFAANSIFCRLALRGGDIDPASFTTIRLLGGTLCLLCLIRPTNLKMLGGSWRGGLYLFVYAYLFAVAYIQLDAGVGALILFGAVQITLFAVGWSGGEKVRLRALLGMLVAFSGLVILLAPGGSAPPLGSALLMMVAGVAWGAYSALGRWSVNPLADTAGNFLRSLPLLAVVASVALIHESWHVSPIGALYASASGVLASGAGYAVWYAVVRRLRAQTAAILQLSVPVFACAAGVIVLDEPLSVRLAVASAVVLSGIALALTARRF
ncbi:DMT family transporter [Pseudomonas sp. RC10]|uniref:DMT family transporter n=1 Tax=Pseudomonas bambusae TaxID=3139142 RepID=UPI0031392842